MRKISLLLSAFVIALSTSIYAEEPVQNKIVTYEKPIIINNETYKVVRTIENDNLSIKVVNKNAKVVWNSIALGMQAWNFKLNNEPKSLEVEDLDGDSVPEIITACTIGDVQSALYIFKYDKAKKNFSAINFGYIGYDGMERDFMVSDVPADNGDNMVFENKTKIRCLGKIYTPDGPKPGYYIFELKDGKFMTGEPIAADMENNPSSPVKEVVPVDKPINNQGDKPLQQNDNPDDDDSGGIG